MDKFLVQVSADLGYANITNNKRYENVSWARKPRDSDHGEVRPGDELLVYCTSNVPESRSSLAFRVVVNEVSPDKITFKLDEPHWFPSPLGYKAIRSLVAEGKLQDIFRKCGTEGFNITKLDPLAAQQVLEFVEVGSSGSQEDEVSSPSSHLDRSIEIHLEQWLVDHWNQVDFGAKLRLYREDGESVGQQYDTKAVGRIDLLCEDLNSGAIVVVELKRGRQSDVVMGQLARYMGWVKEHLANGREVEGIVLTPEYDEKLRYAAKVIPGCRLLRYETRFIIHQQDT